MSNRLNAQLEELSRLWLHATRDSLLRIPILCQEIEQCARGGQDFEIDSGRLRKLMLLASRGERRMTESLAIQSRTGTYSVQGTHEISRYVTTSGWEG